MNRRLFIQLTAGLSGIAGLGLSCKPGRRINGRIVGASSSAGHLLRDRKAAEPSSFSKKDLVIIGGGISGLSAARHLHANNFSDFVLLELENETGGNAASGNNELSQYPWGAHYIPTPNNDLAEYLQFLEECGVIVAKTSKGLPVYNDLYLCFDPQERLYINGRWQDGLIPHFGVSSAEVKQIDSFMKKMEEYRNMKDAAGLYAFAIPVDASSKEEQFLELDKMTMKEWLDKQGYTSRYLHQYVNYCSRDDFGTPHHQVSAWAGIHYFAGRKGKGKNAAHGDVLTWPEGNGFLAGHLKKDLKSQIRTNAMAIKVQLTKDGVSIDVMDTKTHNIERIQARHCIMAIPQFVAARLLQDNQRLETVHASLSYAPWMVANLKVGILEERSGAPLSWDNVLHDSPSLGYVEATHELLEQLPLKKNITYYLPLTDGTPSQERKRAQEKTIEAWTEEIMNDLEKIHPNIRDATEEVNVMIWGHAMAQPLTGTIHGDTRKKLSDSIDNKIHFAHTDLAGISIFEEAFYQGIGAAKKILQT